MPWNRAGVSRFVWVASSPSPAEVAELEVQFPDIIQVRTEALEAEATAWEERAIIARSFHRWVPPEVIIREFHRAGIAGDIEALCLSHRCYVFKFADHNSKEMALGRPWVANGQPIATEAWSPEFIPSVDSVARALLWVRLPNLPLEFWTDEILRDILAPAGDFAFSDSSTKERSRGGFARACVRVDLRSPLRPGVRVRGSRAPFWQQFAFEHLDGICPRCGSLHLYGSCSSVPDSESSSAGAKFGPWMAALRQPRSSLGLPSVTGGSVLDGSALDPAAGAATGWQVPARVARRRPGKASMEQGHRNSSTSNAGFGTKKNSSEVAGVPGGVGRAGSGTVVISPEAGLGSQTESLEVQINLNSKLLKGNPFALLDSDKSADGPTIRLEALPGPLKRARPEVAQVHRVTTKNDKKKGKAKSSASDVVLGRAFSDILCGCRQYSSFPLL